MQALEINLLQRIKFNSHQVKAQVREVVTVGLFQAVMDRSTDMTWLNYAVAIAPLLLEDPFYRGELMGLCAGDAICATFGFSNGVRRSASLSRKPPTSLLASPEWTHD